MQCGLVMYPCCNGGVGLRWSWWVLSNSGYSINDLWWILGKGGRDPHVPVLCVWRELAGGVEDSLVSELLCVAGAPQMQRSGLSLSPCYRAVLVAGNMFQLLLGQEGVFSGFWNVSKRGKKKKIVQITKITVSDSEKAVFDSRMCCPFQHSFADFYFLNFSQVLACFSSK